VRDNDKVEYYEDKFKYYVSEMFEELRRSTKKPATLLKKFTVKVDTFNNLDIDINFKQGNTTEYQLGEWIIQLSVLIPIQIAVARNNLFIPLRDGLSSDAEQGEPEDEYARHIDAIAQNISFGWYEGIFKYFGNRQVKVVSSMGEQSCGKSYMLNHLVGTTFDGSAMRCTEGVWMSLAITKKYIYVALDFEGLKSLERTPQEDLFLTLFNTVVSNMILFKNQFAVNRDMSTMFQRFQDGATLFESDPKIFQAKLCIIIKDVPRQDRDDIVREFSLKFNSLVAEVSYIVLYKNISVRVYIKKLLDEQQPKYENARTFLQNTKVIMAKLKICDWGSLDENLVQIRVSTLKRFLPTVISLGIEKKYPTTELLLNRDTGLNIDDPVVPISDICEDFSDSKNLSADSGLLLFEENREFVRLSLDLRVYFEENIQQRDEAPNDTTWFDRLEKFFKYIVKRRVLRVQEWFNQNTVKFPQDNNDVMIGRYAMEQEIAMLTSFWELCGLTCNNCYLKCLNNRDHEGAHDCLTNHECHTNCQFVEAHINENPIPKCSYKAGHEGKHACSGSSHLCGGTCYLSGKRKCQIKCSKEIGHEDENHLCQSTRHCCGAPCSLVTKNGKYKCPNECNRPCEEQHDKHQCENEKCPIQCPVNGCPLYCKSKDHFHALSDSDVNHFCGNEHQCQKPCKEPGVCRIQLEPKKQEETYKGLVKDTSITFTKYIQMSETLPCSKKIPPDSFEHAGIHSHEGKFCEYYCDLPFGHSQPLHETRHGNMVQTEFTTEDNDNEFVYGGHKLKAGDEGTFHCKELGRHRHIDYCNNVDECKLNQGLQHINGRVHPNPEKAKDFMSHGLFWERTGFKDPYSAQEQQEFSKCDHECRDEKHNTSDNPSKSYCEMRLFHDLLDPSQTPPNECGYISLDGHHFHCENPSKYEVDFHIIFVLDRSSSMNGRDKRPIQGTPIYESLVKNHNNRLGAVYNAVYSFLKARLSSQAAQYNEAVCRDTVSLILFDFEATIAIENQPFNDPENLLTIMLQHNSRTGTNFNAAILKAGYIIEKHFNPMKTNIILFCSDGECGIPKDELNKICSKSKNKGSPIFLNTILFSSSIDCESLKQMADIAQSYLPKESSSSALRCQFTRAIDEVVLINTFSGIAESLRKHKPTLLKKDTL
ncbi:9944_t:CDS:10, partial [Cetraspora pellucida]